MDFGCLILKLVESHAEESRDRTVYIIRNGRNDPLWQPVPRRSASVARQAIDELIHVQALNDLYGLEVAADQNGEGFDVACIGSDFDYPSQSAVL